MADTADQLAWEEQQRPRVAAAALAASLLGLGGALLSNASLGDAPGASLVDSLANLEKAGPIATQPSLRAGLFSYYDAHGTGLVISALLLGLASLAAAFVLLRLGQFVRSRSDRLPRIAPLLAIGGGGGVLIGSLVTAIGTLGWLGDLLASNRTVGAFDAIDQPPVMIFGQILVQLGGLLLAGAYILTNLHAMRVGLLPRAWAIVGMFAGLMIVVPVLAISQLVQIAWLIAIALIALARWPGGVPPAWVTGNAEPWPSSASMREQRMAAKRGERPAPDPEVVEERAAGKQHPSSKKRKRKRRN